MKKLTLWIIVSSSFGVADAQTHTNRLPEHFGKQSGPGGTWVAPKAQESSAAPGGSSASEGSYSGPRSNLGRSSRPRPLSRRLKSAGAQLERALQATNRGHFREALSAYRRALRSGGRRSRWVRDEALLGIVVLQSQHRGLGHDWGAFRWVKRRAREFTRRCHCRGLYALALIADNGVNRPRNVDEAGGRYQRIEACLAQGRGALSPTALAHVRRRLASIPEELAAETPQGRVRTKAKKLDEAIAARARHWDERAQEALKKGGGAMLEHAVERYKESGPERRKWFERAAKEGEERLAAHLSTTSGAATCQSVVSGLLRVYSYQHGMKDAPAMLLGALRRAAEAGVGDCDYAYGRAMSFVRRGPTGAVPTEAFQWLCRAAARGHVAAKEETAYAEAKDRVKCADLSKPPASEPRPSESAEPRSPSVSGGASGP